MQTLQYSVAAALNGNKHGSNHAGSVASSRPQCYKRGFRAGRRGECVAWKTPAGAHAAGALMSTTATPPKGLEGIVATNSSICYIDGDRGVLAYRGYDIHDLAEHSTFEETCYLLWNGRLPKRQELDAFTRELAAAREMDDHIVRMLREFPKTAKPMEVLRTAVS